MATTIKYTDFSISCFHTKSLAISPHPLHHDEQGQQHGYAQTFDIDESKVFQAYCCSFLSFYWPEPGGMGCFGCTAEGDFLCLGIL